MINPGFSANERHELHGCTVHLPQGRGYTIIDTYQLRVRLRLVQFKLKLSGESPQYYSMTMFSFISMCFNCFNNL
jgi:hypothetical protein